MSLARCSNAALSVINVIYKVNILHGGIGYDPELFMFSVTQSELSNVLGRSSGAGTTVTSTSKKQIISATFTNFFEVDLSIESVNTTDCQPYFTSNVNHTGFSARPHHAWPAIDLTFDPSLTKTTTGDEDGTIGGSGKTPLFICSLQLKTNVSEHSIPIYL